jgi:hypothetical protein
MPDDAGSIIFDDPRGPRPPFDAKLTLRPLAGDLVLFPSWLIHQVCRGRLSPQQCLCRLNAAHPHMHMHTHVYAHA